MSFDSLLEIMIAFNRNMFRLDKPEDTSIQYVEIESVYAENIFNLDKIHISNSRPGGGGKSLLQISL